MALDPEFAPTPFRYRDEPAPAGYYGSPAGILEDIASLEEDIRGWEKTARSNRLEIPKLERETLICERDIAIAKLEILQLQKRYEELIGGTR